MIIYNTTYHVAETREEEFIQWLRSEYIPRAIAGGELSSPQLTLVMSNEPDRQGNSYSLQFHAPSVEALEIWYRKTGIALVKEIESTFSQHVMGFSTLMQKLDL